MTELDFCTKQCGELTPSQKAIVEHHISKGSFLGAGQAQGRSATWPEVLIGKTRNVIGPDGYYRLSSISGGTSYENR